jgi:hypothetical protein
LLLVKYACSQEVLNITLTETTEPHEFICHVPRTLLLYEKAIGIKLSELEVDYNLERWLDKWQFILRNDKELSRASANLALTQLNDIIQYEFELARKESTER